MEKLEIQLRHGTGEGAFEVKLEIYPLKNCPWAIGVKTRTGKHRDETGPTPDFHETAAKIFVHWNGLVKIRGGSLSAIVDDLKSMMEIETLIQGDDGEEKCLITLTQPNAWEILHNQVSPTQYPAPPVTGEQEKMPRKRVSLGLKRFVSTRNQA
jgi:hypothetical protein